MFDCVCALSFIQGFIRHVLCLKQSWALLCFNRSKIVWSWEIFWISIFSIFERNPQSSPIVIRILLWFMRMNDSNDVHRVHCAFLKTTLFIYLRWTFLVSNTFPSVHSEWENVLSDFTSINFHSNFIQLSECKVQHISVIRCIKSIYCFVFQPKSTFGNLICISSTTVFPTICNQII